MMTLLKVVHWIGLLLLIAGLTLYGLTEVTHKIAGMVLVASLIGFGLVMMSPFPIVLFIQWAKAQDDSKKDCDN
ncbi:hypothetical protein [Shewanella sp. Isolate11]|uniref:hypothetical protein n=1 Tax=Shewanella sp. Isolate11 TaxID=2908530 RepID=UPI001EFCB573|nr:hypothetical protein [Shewanella sp. Isolate11]MCG9695715.1 hypothetical protein [Shewanella sp. Isolate11]